MDAEVEDEEVVGDEVDHVEGLEVVVDAGVLVEDKPAEVDADESSDSVADDALFSVVDDADDPLSDDADGPLFADEALDPVTNDDDEALDPVEDDADDAVGISAQRNSMSYLNSHAAAGFWHDSTTRVFSPTLKPHCFVVETSQPSDLVK